jgi:hypothetical protein
MKLDLDIHHYFEFFGLLAAILFRKQLRGSFMLLFLPYLALNLLLEVLSNFLYNSYDFSSFWLTEASSLLSLVFYSFIFLKLLNNNKYHQIIVGSLIFYLLSFAISIILFGLSPSVFKYSLVGAAFLLIISSGLVFYQNLLMEELHQPVQMLSGLYLAAGVLIFNAGISIVLFSVPYIHKYKLTLLGNPLFNTIPRLLCMVLYPCIIISLYKWRTPAK